MTYDYSSGRFGPANIFCSCGGKTMVTKSEGIEQKVYRTRKCKVCGETFTTTETRS
jgi:transcriptional regulator NrdR family protein